MNSFYFVSYLKTYTSPPPLVSTINFLLLPSTIDQVSVFQHLFYIVKLNIHITTYLKY